MGACADGASKRTVMAKDQEAVTLEFLKTELETGHTFANLALSAKYADKLERNKANARKAYDTARKFLASASVDANSALELNRLLEDLRAKLDELGEAV